MLSETNSQVLAFSVETVARETTLSKSFIRNEFAPEN